jgi:hypothetical protein
LKELAFSRRIGTDENDKPRTVEVSKPRKGQLAEGLEIRESLHIVSHGCRPLDNDRFDPGTMRSIIILLRELAPREKDS